jgi:hypothetical protein
MPKHLTAIRENGDVQATPFTHRGKVWVEKSAEAIRDRLLAVQDKKDVAEFLNYAGYVVMRDAGEGRMTPAPYPIEPQDVSARLMSHVMDWKAACGEILVPSYRYPAKQAESPLGLGSVRHLARRGTGRSNGILAAFDWDNSGQPRLTVKPATRLEAAVLSCHVAKLRHFRYGQCVICGNVYQLKTNRKGRKYCGGRCGLNVAQARYRDRLRKKKRKARRRRK